MPSLKNKITIKKVYVQKQAEDMCPLKHNLIEY